jgi:hypothetical protein
MSLGLLDWVRANCLDVQETEKHESPWTAPNYCTRIPRHEDGTEKEHKLHTVDFMNNEGKGVDIYSVENSFYLKAVWGGDDNGNRAYCLEGVKILCEEGDKGGWDPYSYVNTPGKEDGEIWVKFPTSLDPKILDRNVDTKVNHLKAVELTMERGWEVPLFICVQRHKAFHRGVYVNTKVICAKDGESCRSYLLKIIKKKKKT